MVTMHIKPVSESDAIALVDYYCRNAEHFKAWEPTRPDDFENLARWLDMLKDREEEVKQGKAAYFIAIDEETNNIIGHCSLTNIVYGSFMATYLGYAIDKDFEGQGNMKVLCNHVIEHAFTKLNLHRIMANHMPSNTRSGKLLKSLGFVVEGEAKNYLKINGQWEDHVLTSLTSKEEIYSFKSRKSQRTC